MKILRDLLACPRCDLPLTLIENGFHCGGCKVDFLHLDGVPVLFAEPDHACGEWRDRADFALKKLQQDAASLEREIADTDLGELTIKRLEQLRDAYLDQRALLQGLLQPLLGEAPQTAYPTYLALRTRLPTDQGLQTYYPNIHRDWAWGDEENRRSHELVAAMISAKPERLLVLGAGAGRLAYDLHQSHADSLTVAMDFNPLLMLLAQRVTKGGSVSLYEFPIAPITMADQAVMRTLTADATSPGLYWLLGDVQRPPFIAGSFDVVVTPWLADILPTDFERLAINVNRLLRHGGQWINFGSLAFSHADKARCYSVDELPALFEHCGFTTPAINEEKIPYLCSPASRHGRVEQVVITQATKNSAAPKQERYVALPDWIVTGQQPVPLLPDIQIQAASTRIHSYLLGLIDGKRSVQDMAELMEQQRLMTRVDAEASIRTLLIKLYESSNS